MRLTYRYRPPSFVWTSTVAISALVLLFGCSSGLGNNLPVQAPTGSSNGSTANLATGLDLGVTPSAGIETPALAGAVMPDIAGAGEREVVFLAFTTTTPANDADGAGSALAREATVDTNGTSDVFVAMIAADGIDEHAFSQSLVAKFRHPRCTTCHGMAMPGTLAFASSPQPHAGPSPGLGFPSNDPAACAGCHVDGTNNPVLGWQSPAASFDFSSKSVAQLAQMAMNVPIDELEHFAEDPRVLWALDSGILPMVGGRNGVADDDHDGILEPEDSDGVVRTVPGGSAAFLREIEEWRAHGSIVTSADAVQDVVLASRAFGSSDGSAADGASRRPVLRWVANPSFDPARFRSTNPVGTLYVAFESDATNLVAGDSNGATDVFRTAIEVRAGEDSNGATATVEHFNLVTQTSATLLCSAQDGGATAGNGASSAVALGGADADFVTFESVATDLISGFVDGNGAAGSDVYVRAIGSSSTVLVSHSMAGATTGANGSSSEAAISERGDVVAWSSEASDLVAVDTNGERDVFYSDVSVSAPLSHVRASVASGGVEATGGASANPSVCSDGSGGVLVAFESAKTDLATVAATQNVFLYDSAGAGTTTLLNQKAEHDSSTAMSSVAIAASITATPGNGDASDPIIAEDGSAVLFVTAADNVDVLRDDDNDFRDICIVELAQVRSDGLVLPFRVSVTNAESAPSNGDSTTPMFGSFGGASSRYGVGFAAYMTEATNLGTSDSTPLMLGFLDESSGVLARFDADVVLGGAPLQVMFSDGSTGTPTEWSWDFDDDGSADSTDQNPTHVFTDPGTFIVRMTATASASGSSGTASTQIRVLGPPAASFTTSATSGVLPLTVAFTDTSTEIPTSWGWDFDGDDVIDSTLQNPSFDYATAGVYSVRLVATGLGGSGETIATNLVSVFEPVVAEFSGNTLAGVAPLSVDFADLSTGAPTAWAWDFDNDTMVDSTLQNPTFVYASPGNYTVSLTTTGPGGSDTETKASYVAVSGAVVADFSVDADAGYAGYTANFTDMTTGSPTSWQWDFDGDTMIDSTMQNPSFVYTTAGTYSVKLTATGAGGSDSETKTNFITVVVTSAMLTIGASKDNTMISENDNSGGAAEFLYVGNAYNGVSQQGVRRGLIAFDVAASLPSGATVLSAELELINSIAMVENGNRAVDLWRATSDWGEGTSSTGAGIGASPTAGDATWNARIYPGTLWTTPGGDMAMSSSASTIVGAAGTYSWSGAGVVSDVQAWLDTPAGNFGWVVRGIETPTLATAKRFESRENSTTGSRPRLIITFQPPLP